MRALVEAVQKPANEYREDLTAPRFDCDFLRKRQYRAQLHGDRNAKAVLEPFNRLQTGHAHDDGAEMAAVFVRETQDIEKIDATGDGKFNELDRNGIANGFSYTAADETVRCARRADCLGLARAHEKQSKIDSNNATHISICRARCRRLITARNRPTAPRLFAK
jgi:hypothetical protein